MQNSAFPHCAIVATGQNQSLGIQMANLIDEGFFVMKKLIDLSFLFLKIADT
jgi:hypothetical protein